MSVPPEQFARIAGQVDLAELHGRLAVVVGIGAVGSQMAEGLANSGVGRLRLIDGKQLQEANLPRHALSRQYVGMNKAEAMTLYLAQEIPTLRAEGLDRHVDDALSNDELDKLLADADLVVAATDNREAQRRVGRRALALDIPAVFPGLYEHDGGEVFVQSSPGSPCFTCWDAFRPAGATLRGVAALNAETRAFNQLAVELCLGILDGDAAYARRFASRATQIGLRQLFILHFREEVGLATPDVSRRPNCPGCAVGPASLAQGQQAGASLPSRRMPVAAGSGLFEGYLASIVSGVLFVLSVVVTLRLLTGGMGAVVAYMGIEDGSDVLETIIGGARSAENPRPGLPALILFPFGILAGEWWAPVLSLIQIVVLPTALLVFLVSLFMLIPLAGQGILTTLFRDQTFGAVPLGATLVCAMSAVAFALSVWLMEFLWRAYSVQ